MDEDGAEGLEGVDEDEDDSDSVVDEPEVDADADEPEVVEVEVEAAVDADEVFSSKYALRAFLWCCSLHSG